MPQEGPTAVRHVHCQVMGGRQERGNGLVSGRDQGLRGVITNLAVITLLASAALVAYAYLLYPLVLHVRARRTPAPPAPPATDPWPSVTVVIPAYNEEHTIAGTLDAVLSLDYPRDRLHVLVVSDASTDRTDEIARSYAGQGVELLRLPQRGGKTAAENAARSRLRGEIVLNTDASVRLHRGALKPLVARFADPSVGIASGCDVSVAALGDRMNTGESRYVDYEMRVRDLETRAGGIVGASGCLYAIRRDLHDEIVPSALSRDFVAALIARERGFRAVSVNDALCYVPRVRSLRAEYRRKVRTITRGIETLFFKRHLLDPFRYGWFAWMLLSHKVCRWLVPPAAVLALAALAVLATSLPAARYALGAAGVVLVLGMLGWLWPVEHKPPRVLALAGYVVASNAAVLHALLRAVRGELNPVWEPTRRDTVGAG